MIRFPPQWIETRRIETRRIAAWILAAIGLLGGARLAWGDEAEDRAAALAAVRAAAAGRDLKGIKAKFAEAEKLRGEEKYDAELNRLGELLQYLDQFWKAVDRGAATAQGNLELKIGEDIVAVAEFDGNSLTLREEGKNRRYTLASVPSRVCLALAEQVLKPGDGVNQVIFGTFHLLDAKGDRRLAKQYFEAAAKAKVDVAPLMAEFEIGPSIPAIEIEIPTLTPAQKLALSEKNWQVQAIGADASKKPIEGVLSQDQEGRLKAKIPASAGAADSLVAISPKRLFAGNFQFAAIVVGLKENHTLRLTAGQDSGYTAPLPKGTVKIELVRQGAKVACRINGVEVELKEFGKVRPQLVTTLSIGAPIGSEFTIAAVEWTTR